MKGNNKSSKSQNSENIEYILKLFNSKNFLKAKEEIKKQIKVYPNSYTLFNVLGAIFAEEGQFQIAIDNYRESIKINPKYAQAYNNLGVSFHKLNKIDAAIESYKKAIDLKKDFLEAYSNLAGCLKDDGKLKDAVQFYQKAIEINPEYVEANYGLGHAYDRIGNKKNAENHFLKVIKIKKNYIQAYLSLGTLYHEQMRYEEAMLNYKQAIKLNPDYEKPYNNLGNLLCDVGRFDDAMIEYKKAIKIKPDYAKAYSNMLFTMNFKNNFEKDLYLSEAKKFKINCKKKTDNFSMNYQYEKNPKKLRVGLVSADFGNHPGGFFTLSTLRELRKKDCDLIAYSNFNRTDEFVKHFRPQFVKWNSIEKKNDEEVIKQIIEDKIHILIDLQGHSAKNRLTIFFYKPAPVQATWLGQGSTGINEIDYFLGSDHLIPKNEENHYVEKVLRFPEISQCFTQPDFEIKIEKLPAIKNNFITFGCLNKFAKMNEEVISLWSKILSSIPKSKLILKSREFENSGIIKETLKKFNKYNINNDRLIIMGKSNTRQEVLEIFNKIDLALDPFPFQGNTSTCEALWMGVPVITLKGNRYLFHFGESINSNLNMDDWIAESKEDYISKAVKFASNLKELSRIRENLRNIVLNSPVINANRFADHFNKILWKMWKDFQSKNS